MSLKLIQNGQNECITPYIGTYCNFFNLSFNYIFQSNNLVLGVISQGNYVHEELSTFLLLSDTAGKHK